MNTSSSFFCCDDRYLTPCNGDAGDTLKIDDLRNISSNKPFLPTSFTMLIIQAVSSMPSLTAVRAEQEEQKRAAVSRSRLRYNTRRDVMERDVVRGCPTPRCLSN